MFRRKMFGMMHGNLPYAETYRGRIESGERIKL
jgi:hypothetical protein